MHRFMATRRPTGSPAQKARMIAATNGDSSSRSLLLEMAFETKRCVPLQQHLLVHRTMHRMTSRAAFAHRFVLENEGAMLRRVAFGAIVTLRIHRSERGCCVAFVRLMAISAGHFAFEHRMMMRQIKFAAFVEVALETGVRRLLRINNGVVRSARLVMNAAGAVARFTADL